MNIGELKKIITNIPDDFTIELRIRTRLSDDEIVKRKYPYPFDTLIATNFQLDDIGYSDKQACFGCETTP